MNRPKRQREDDSLSVLDLVVGTIGVVIVVGLIVLMLKAGA